jgi:peptidoglycan hydrolase-like protein with peptidoglycan-binding domain
MTTPSDLIAQCPARAGRPYFAGDGRRLFDDASPGNDCSGLIYVVLQAAGITPGGTVSSSQARWCYDNGGELGVGDALETPGALLFMGANRGLAGFGADGHVAIVTDPGVVFESPCSAGHYSGFSNARGRPWSGGGLIPGVIYPPNSPRPTPGTSPADDYLRVGSTGDRVATLQHRLNRLGADLVIDGDFGPLTDTAVRGFQAGHGLEVDGVVGPLTWQAIADAVPELPADQAPDVWPTPVNPETPPPWPGRYLTVGVTGEDVRAWQARMLERGWSLDVDGIFGPQSEAVARAFQAEKALEVDGIVGPVTWSAAWLLPIT